MTDSGVLKYGEHELDLPVVEATQGNDGLDISKLLATTGVTTLDPGFVNTASCVSSITFIDGDKGVLQYRGYPIEQLAEKATFIEVAYLLIYGELPTQAELDEFNDKIARRMLLDERMRELFRAFPRGAHPMQVLAAGVTALGSFNRETLDVHNAEQVEEASLRLLGAMPTLAAYAYKSSIGAPFLYPRNALGYVENYLRLSFGTPQEEYEIDSDVVRAFETLFILHADHEQNASTSTVRLVGSADANIYASMASGVHALSGPLHGGANQAVLEMLREISKEGLDIKDFVAQVKDKKSGVKLMGFGHRVYKNYDPRAAIVKETAHEVLAHLGGDELLDLAMKLEEIALADDYFVSRKLYPNVDFYTGLIYRAMGFPTEFFTVLFAIGRLPGWIAQFREQLALNTKINRPRQIYTGEAPRSFVPRSER